MTSERCRLLLVDHEEIEDNENNNNPDSDTTDIEEKEVLDFDLMMEMNVNIDLTTEEFKEINKDDEDEILLMVNLRDDNEDSQISLC